MTPNAFGGIRQDGGGASSGSAIGPSVAFAPPAEATAPLADATSASTPPGAAANAAPAAPPPPPETRPEPYYEDLELGPGKWHQSCPQCGSAIRWEIFGVQRKVFCRCAAYPECIWKYYSKGDLCVCMYTYTYTYTYTYSYTYTYRYTYTRSSNEEIHKHNKSMNIYTYIRYISHVSYYILVYHIYICIYIYIHIYIQYICEY